MSLRCLLGLGVLMLGVSLLSCGVSDRSEDYQLSSVADLTLTQTNHPHGFARSECFNCHVKVNIHRVNRLNASSFDLASDLVEQSGLKSCSGCHGTNGVSP